MEPTEEYKKKQQKLYELHEKQGKTPLENGLAKKLGTELRKMFAEAFKLKQLTWKESEKIRVDLQVGSLDGFDHCTYWQTADGGYVIVTQPYLKNIKGLLEQQITMGDFLKAKVIEAPEWGFYYPTRTSLALIYLDADYDELAKMRRN